MEQLRMFINGQAMRGGSLHDALAQAEFLGSASTASRYRFFSVRDEFPGLFADPDADATQNAGIAGELYAVTYQVLREHLLPREPAELELGVIELSDGSGSLSMLMRDSAITAPRTIDITAHRSWSVYLKASGVTE